MNQLLLLAVKQTESWGWAVLLVVFTLGVLVAAVFEHTMKD